MDRRTLLKRVVQGFTAATALMLGVPAIGTLLAPVVQRRSGPVWAPLGPLDAFPVGTVTAASAPVERDDDVAALRVRGVFVWRPDAEAHVVFSRACTDLGCPLNWDPGSGWYFCPCHGGIFDEAGERRAGPPNRPLDRYATRVRGGVLEIDLASVPPVG